LIAKGRVQMQKFSWETCAKETLEAYQWALRSKA